MNNKTKSILIFTILLLSIGVAYGNDTSISVNVTILSPTPTPIPIISSGGGSSGGMGIITDEPYGNIAFSERIEKHWYYNKSVLYSFKCDIYEVVVLPLQSEGEVILKLEILKDKSNKTLLPIDSVYGYFNLYSGSKRFKDGIIRFRTNIDWDVDVVTLMKWTGTEWKPLTTVEIGSDITYKYYEAYTDTFSNFVIVGTPKIVEVITPVITTPQPTIIINETIEIPEEKSIIINYVAFALVIIGMIISIGYIIYKNIDKEINDKKKKK